MLRDLYYRAEEALSGDMRAKGPKQRVAAAKEALAEVLDAWPTDELEAHTERFYDGYWLGIDTDTQAWHAEVMRTADQSKEQLAIATRSDQFKAMTEILVYAADHPGLFSRIAGAMAVARVNIVDARISTTHDGMAVDTFIVQDMDENALSDPQRLDKLRDAVARTLAGEVRPRGVIAGRKPGYSERTRVFKVEPVVLIDNNISNTWTVIEVNGRDRPGFIHDVAWALFNLSLNVGRARIATYGERAVDVFYVRDMFGLKIDDPNRHDRIRQRLIEAIQPTAATATAKPAAAKPAKATAAAAKPAPKAQKTAKG